MVNKIKDMIKHPLIYGGSIVIIGNLVANFFNFLFNLLMSRSLSNADYGILASLISLIGFPTLIASAIVPIAVQFAGEYYAKGQLHMVRGLYIKIVKFLLIIGISIFIIFLLTINQISSFLQIQNIPILVITDVIILLTFVGFVNVAFTQAKLAFTFQVFVVIVGAILKLLFGFVAVISGFSVTGTIVALLLSSIIAYILSFIPIKFIFDREVSPPEINTKQLFTYGIPSTLTLIGLTSLISMDVLLVKHFFDPTKAGIYASLSLVGRVIFYLSAPIGSVMFPIIVQKHSKNENFTNTFKLSLFLVFVPSVLLTLFYFVFPKYTILFFSNKTQNLAVSPLLGPFGIFITLYCLLSIIANFYISIKKTIIFLPIILGAILQIALINLYHKTFSQILMVSIGITFLLVVGFLLYYPYAIKSKILPQPQST